MSKRVLIIDDDKDFASMLKQYLTSKDFIVYTAETLQSGINKTRLLVPDFVVLDNQLPDGSGWTQVDSLHSLVPAMHIILVSAYSIPKELLFSQDIPVSILEKPLSRKDLLSVLNGSQISR